MAEHVPSVGYVLVVDDDRDVRELLCELLELAGHDAKPAANGAEALQVLRRGPLPVLILLDLDMPVMDGCAFRAAQQCDAAIAVVPVFLLSGEASLDLRAAELGVQAHFTKPLPLRAFLEAVKGYSLPRFAVASPPL